LFAQVKDNVLAGLDRQGLVIKAGGSSQRYILAEPYATLADREQRIGSRYLVPEVDQFLMAIQRKSLRIGELQELLSGALNRNQIRYLVTKLYEDDIVGVEGVSRGTRYFLRPAFARLSGDALVQAVISHLREKFG
jgi:ATP-dependent DNA helicase RecG